MAAGQSLQVCAAPHLPAGFLSPYSDGERGALIDGFANHQRYRMFAKVAASPSPRHYTGRRAGRAMRGGADFDDCL
ncbi:MAG: hypothetical protein E5X73_08195 [Mesorhizobium sp.]|nr:MAG: hypothetical protein E5X73_08195 [Mesorhizobium sp.]